MNKFLTIVASALMASGLAKASSYDANSFATSGSGYSFSSSGNLGFKTIDGWTGLGIEGGPSGNEVDLGQFLQVSFLSPEVVNSLSLAFLYDGPEYGDPNEKALITINGTTTYTLQATGEFSAIWSGPGSVQNLSGANGVNGAVWKLTNPFGNNLVNSIKFESISVPGGVGNDTDYSLQSFGTSVPTPDSGSTLGLLSLVLVSCGVLKRKIRA